MKNNNKQNGKGTTLTSSDNVPMTSALDRFFDDRLWLESMDIFRNVPRVFSQIGRGIFPKVDVTQTDKEIKVTADVPGINPDDIEIDVRDNWMTISGKSEREVKSDEKPYRYERSYGEFRREFSLPGRVREDEIKAISKDGVLTITLLKDGDEKKKKVVIEKK